MKQMYKIIANNWAYKLKFLTVQQILLRNKGI